MKFLILFWFVIIGACFYDKVRADFGNTDGTTFPDGLPASPPVPGNWAPYNLGTVPPDTVRTNSTSPLPTLTAADIPKPPEIINPTPPDGWKAAPITTDKLHSFAITTPRHWMLTVKGEAYHKAETNDPNEMKMVFTGADGSRWLATWKLEPAPKK